MFKLIRRSDKEYSRRNLSIKVLIKKIIESESVSYHRIHPVDR